jgi:hypothetical protein
MVSFASLSTRIVLDPAGDQCLLELQEALKSASVSPILPGPGALSAHEVRATYDIRARTTAAAGIESCGFETTLLRLANLAAQDTVLLFGFSGHERLFTVFVRQQDETIVGCVRILRGDPAPPLTEQGLA